MPGHEAVRLVVQAAAMGLDGKALVLGMGVPGSNDAWVRQFFQFSAKKVDVAYTGPRKGEKMAEKLLANGGPDDRPVYPVICYTPVPRLDALSARELDRGPTRPT